MTQLFDALRRVVGKDQGVVFIDSRTVYRHWIEPENTVNFVIAGSSHVAFVDQEVRFDDHGATQVADTMGRLREVRILVMVPFGPRLQTFELINPPTTDSD